MKIADLERTGALAAACAGGLCYRSGPFTVRLRTGQAPLVRLFGHFYGGNERFPDDTQTLHFDVRVESGAGLRRFWRRQAVFWIDAERPFEPYPWKQGFPLFEWGLNWCIAMRAHQYLMLHAAVVERMGGALLLPAMPGSGKSTLCAALACRGWRLFSDEFGLVDTSAPLVVPMPRPIALKNVSIEVIRRYAPDAVLGPVFPGTRKGDVAHLRPPADAVLRQGEPAQPRWIVFPRFIRGAATSINALPESLAFTRLAQNAFNYRVLGRLGFERLADLIRSCRSYALQYGDLDAAVEAIGELTADARQGGS